MVVRVRERDREDPSSRHGARQVHRGLSGEGSRNLRDSVASERLDRARDDERNVGVLERREVVPSKLVDTFPLFAKRGEAIEELAQRGRPCDQLVDGAKAGAGDEDADGCLLYTSRCV